MKLSAFRFVDEGLWDNPAGGSTGAEERYGGSFRALWTPSPNFDLDLILDVADQSGLPVPMPVILETTLDEDGVRDVLAALEEKTPEAAKLRNAKTGMCAIFHEPDHPFMKLH